MNIIIGRKAFMLWGAAAKEGAAGVEGVRACVGEGIFQQSKRTRR